MKAPLKIMCRLDLANHYLKASEYVELQYQRLKLQFILQDIVKI